MSVVHIESSPLQGNETLLPDPYDQYFHTRYREADRPDLAVDAWRIHAEGYRTMGFVHAEAVTPEGYLTRDIDKARGPHVDYFLATHPDKENDQASMRKVNLVEGQTYRDLPAYELCKDFLWRDGEHELATIEDPVTRLKEIGALARTADAHPLAVLEIFRNVIHGAMQKDGNGEMWFASIVSKTHDFLVNQYGERNFKRLGEDVPIVDDRVGDHIALTPVLIQPDNFIENILLSYKEAKVQEIITRQQGHKQEGPLKSYTLKRSFLFFTDGLHPNQMSDEVAAARQEMLAARKRQGA